MDPRATWSVRGRRNAREQLRYYLSRRVSPESTKKHETRLLGRNFSSKWSVHFAPGFLSPAETWHAIDEFEREVVRNESTYWLKFEILWREYFRWWGRLHGSQVYHYTRRSGSPPLAPERFEAWCTGQTGVPFVDANMQELVATGFMSNRGRQNVASYLVRELDQDWRWGAAFFESHLLDYDVGSNWETGPPLQEPVLCRERSSVQYAPPGQPV